MRLGEIAQLHVGDIKQEGDIWYFDIAPDSTTGTKRVKSMSSKRFVPVHPDLIAIGFLKYYQSIKDSNAPRLWMKLNQLKSTGKYDRNFSSWFLSDGRTGFNERHITKDKGKIFHSFRHTFIDALKQIMIETTLIAEIVGHSNDSITLDTYGKPYVLETRQEAMMKLDYGIDIEPLKRIAKAI